MSQYYKGKRTRNIFDPLKHGKPATGQAKSKDTFKLSRSKIDMFLNCPRCFYIDRRLGVGQPPGYPFTLNSAVDTLLKKEFDVHRANGTAHPLMKHYKIDAIPFDHEDIDKWRENFVGVQFYHKLSNFLVTGAIDDVWQKTSPPPSPSKGEGEMELIVVDYKATSKDSEITLDADWQIGYKRQMEIYQWLLRQNEFKVSDTGYFVYANGKKDREAFDGRLEFDVTILPYTGNDSWVEGALVDARECLISNKIPNANPDCDFCTYREAVRGVEK